MRTLLQISFRTLLGADMHLAVGCYIVVSLIWGQGFAVVALVGAVVFSHWPDLDMFPYLLARKRWKIRSHWVFFHHPALAIPLAGYVGWLVGGGSREYWASLALVCTSMHFMHDSLDETGFPILSPFSQKLWTLTWFGFRRMSRAMAEKFYEEQRLGELNIDKELMVRMPKVKLASLVWQAGSVIALGLFWLYGK